MKSLLVRMLVLAVAMFMGGGLGTVISLPPEYVSPLWPPTGIALAGMLIWGRVVWPGIFIGAFANQFLLVHDFTPLFSTNNLYFSLLIASANTLQALIGLWLSAQWLQPGLPRLDTPRSIALFFIVAGPLACMVTATLGVNMLVILDRLSFASSFSSWWSWWIRDSLGVLIIAPLIFCCFGHPRELWLARCTSVALPLLGTLLAVSVIFILVFRSEQASEQLTFDSQASSIDRLLINYTDSVIDTVLDLRAMYEGSSEVTRQDFSIYAQNQLKRHPEILALEWLPHVKYQSLLSFEKQVRAEGFHGFKVIELNAKGVPVRVARREEYFPVMFVEPMAGNVAVLGFDSYSNPISRQAKQMARRSGEL